jgi:hypothetical protein
LAIDGTSPAAPTATKKITEFRSIVADETGTSSTRCSPPRMSKANSPIRPTASSRADKCRRNEVANCSAMARTRTSRAKYANRVASQASAGGVATTRLRSHRPKMTIVASMTAAARGICEVAMARAATTSRMTTPRSRKPTIHDAVDDDPKVLDARRSINRVAVATTSATAISSHGAGRKG